MNGGEKPKGSVLLNQSQGEMHISPDRAAGDDPPFRQILVQDLSRLARSFAEFLEHQAKLEANGVTLTSIN